MLCIFLFSTTFAQKNKKETIYLKNGSVLKGRLVQVDDDKVVINSARNTWVFKTSEIDTTMRKSLATTMYQEEKPWFIKATAGILAGSSDNNKSAPFSLMTSFNYRMIDGLYAGLGLGIEFLEESYMPLFASLDYYLRDTNFTPFISFKGGYMLPLDDNSRAGVHYSYPDYSSFWPGPQYESYDLDGGIMLSPSFGFRGMIHQNLGWMFSLGYRYHQLNYSADKDQELERNYNRLTIRVGIIFN